MKSNIQGKARLNDLHMHTDTTARPVSKSSAQISKMWSDWFCDRLRDGWVRYWNRIMEFGEADFFFTGTALLDLKFAQAFFIGMRLVESISSQIPCFGELFTDFTRNLKPNFKKKFDIFAWISWIWLRSLLVGCACPCTPKVMGSSPSFDNFFS